MLFCFFWVVTSFFASYRYWYYGIKVPTTRTKIREYLKTSESVLVFKGSPNSYKSLIGDKTIEPGLEIESSMLGQHSSLEQRCPPGLTPFDFIIFTDAMIAPNEGYLRKLVANRVNRYFPGIVSDEIRLVDRGTHAWAWVDKLKDGTRRREALEDFDLWAPIYINVIAIGSLTVFIILPKLWIFLLPIFQKG